ncbi:DUF6508 domain-containing protein [Microvirga yunnanensis]|uniref:DUF6508 domain-containing protein n=1 Tax=Microvirga yunnanensis TaxID=2953740 RepID=UPI0021CA9BFC|nr:DUF6508 domain-containing protein [Microvirga sp. HBU65207]
MVFSEADIIRRRERLEALVAFLPRFEAEDFQFASWVEPKQSADTIIEGRFTLGREAAAFVKAAYDHDWVKSFKWSSWAQSEEAAQLRDDERVLAHADEDQLAKLLTTCIRSDRFVEGTLAHSFETGLLTRILHRARVLLSELDTTG